MLHISSVITYIITFGLKVQSDFHSEYVQMLMPETGSLKTMNVDFNIHRDANHQCLDMCLCDQFAFCSNSHREKV